MIRDVAGTFPKNARGHGQFAGSAGVQLSIGACSSERLSPSARYRQLIGLLADREVEDLLRFANSP